MILRALLIACVAQSTEEEETSRCSRLRGCPSKVLAAAKGLKGLCGPGRRQSTEEEETSRCSRLRGCPSKVLAAAKGLKGLCGPGRRQQGAQPLLQEEDREANLPNEDRQDQNENCASRCARRYRHYALDPERNRVWSKISFQWSAPSFVVAIMALKLQVQNRNQYPMSMVGTWPSSILQLAFFTSLMLYTSFGPPETVKRVVNPKIARNYLSGRPFIALGEAANKIYHWSYHNEEEVSPIFSSLIIDGVILVNWIMSKLYIKYLATDHTRAYCDPRIAGYKNWNADDIYWIPNMTHVLHHSQNWANPLVPPFDGETGDLPWSVFVQHWSEYSYLRKFGEDVIATIYTVFPMLLLKTVKPLLLYAYHKGQKDKGLGGMMCKFLTEPYTDLLTPKDSYRKSIQSILRFIVQLFSLYKLGTFIGTNVENNGYFSLPFSGSFCNELTILGASTSLMYMFVALAHENLILPMVLFLMTLGADAVLVTDLVSQFNNGGPGSMLPLSLLGSGVWFYFYLFLAGFVKRFWRFQLEPLYMHSLSLEVGNIGVTQENKDKVCASIAGALGGTAIYCSLAGPQSGGRRLINETALYMDVALDDASSAQLQATAPDFVNSLSGLPAHVTVTSVSADEERVPYNPETRPEAGPTNFRDILEREQELRHRQPRLQRNFTAPV